MNALKEWAGVILGLALPALFIAGLLEAFGAGFYDFLTIGFFLLCLISWWKE